MKLRIYKLLTLLFPLLSVVVLVGWADSQQQRNAREGEEVESRPPLANADRARGYLQPSVALRRDANWAATEVAAEWKFTVGSVVIRGNKPIPANKLLPGAPTRGSDYSQRSVDFWVQSLGKKLAAMRSPLIVREQCMREDLEMHRVDVTITLGVPNGPLTASGCCASH